MSDAFEQNRRVTTGNEQRRTSSLAQPRREVVAALDLGTNNCRLLIARPTAGGFCVVDGFSRVVRLGQNIVETGVLSEAAIERTIEALLVCAEKMDRRQVGLKRCIATEAARRARNCTEFLIRVKDKTGIDLEIISSREEAELTLNGCLPLLDERIPYALVFDVGGGSAEIVWLRIEPDRQHGIVGWVSLPVGVVTLTERNGGHDFSREAYNNAVVEIRDMLAPCTSAGGALGGTAGTGTTIAGVTMGLKRYNRTRVDGSYLKLDVVHTVSRNLASSSYEQRAAHPSIGRNRADLVVAGCAMLEAICHTWPAVHMRVADRGVREGILLHLTGGHQLDRQDAAE